MGGHGPGKQDGGGQHGEAEQHAMREEEEEVDKLIH